MVMMTIKLLGNQTVLFWLKLYMMGLRSCEGVMDESL